jgi:hydroxymethylpyrimidine/phosphomethylpyrimidine kinase
MGPISNLLFDAPPPRTSGGRMPLALTIGELQTAGRGGVNADLRAFASAGVHGLVALTGVRGTSLFQPDAGFAPLPEQPIRAQLSQALDIPPPHPPIDVVKVGALGGERALMCVVEALATYKPPCVIIDPELADRRGEPKFTQPVQRMLAALLLPTSDLLVLNAREAELLTSRRVEDRGAMREAYRRLSGDLGLTHVLICGGRAQEHAVDLYFDGEGVIEFGHDRLNTLGMEGLGATLSALIAAHRARGAAWIVAIDAAKQALTHAILNAPRLSPDQSQPDPSISALSALRIDPTPAQMLSPSDDSPPNGST